MIAEQPNWLRSILGTLGSPETMEHVHRGVQFN